MVMASQLRTGMAIRYQGAKYKIVAAEYHPGQGQMSGATHARLQNLDTGTFWEHAFRADLRLEELALEKQALEFLYADANHYYFMNPGTFEQTEVPKGMIGSEAGFLEPGLRVTVEFLERRPVAVTFPDVLEVRIEDTAPPLHSQTDANFKTARLASGIEVMVPQFVKSGDSIRIDVATLRYMDRARARHP
jgi:elongation factor P